MSNFSLKCTRVKQKYSKTANWNNHKKPFHLKLLYTWSSSPHINGDTVHVHTCNTVQSEWWINSMHFQILTINGSGRHSNTIRLECVWTAAPIWMWWLTENTYHEFRLSHSVHKLSKIWLLIGHSTCVYLKQIHSFIKVTSSWYTISILNFPPVFLNPINSIINIFIIFIKPQYYTDWLQQWP